MSPSRSDSKCWCLTWPLLTICSRTSTRSWCRKVSSSRSSSASTCQFINYQQLRLLSPIVSSSRCHEIWWLKQPPLLEIVRCKVTFNIPNSIRQPISRINSTRLQWLSVASRTRASSHTSTLRPISPTWKRKPKMTRAKLTATSSGIWSTSSRRYPRGHQARPAIWNWPLRHPNQRRISQQATRMVAGILAASLRPSVST